MPHQNRHSFSHYYSYSRTYTHTRTSHSNPSPSRDTEHTHLHKKHKHNRTPTHTPKSEIFRKHPDPQNLRTDENESSSQLKRAWEGDGRNPCRDDGESSNQLERQWERDPLHDPRRHLVEGHRDHERNQERSSGSGMGMWKEAREAGMARYREW
ncbi:hypothetical protein P280DRAFT_465066 [Massarina eburnea CBS 473.64]|uniref:Uncharacterized protein n=1 Tax=Massarina eburnea CBS 473.64 TaxID=1395130 RepID=A0A6A6SH89_9PLEO|nr:hypothetical protein P280DRAFT_465066 [Massarina eburnea CBS 473.64]